MTGPGRIWVDVTGIRPGSDAAVFADLLCGGFARIGVEHALCCRDPGLLLFAWPAVRQSDAVPALPVRPNGMSRWRVMADRLPTATRQAIVRFVQLQRAALAMRRKARVRPEAVSALAGAGSDAVTPARGDVLLMLGPYGDASRFQESGAKLVALFAETVPLLRPEWLEPVARDAVAEWRSCTLPVLSDAIALGSRDAASLAMAGMGSVRTVIPAAATVAEPAQGALPRAVTGRYILAAAPIGVAGATRQLLLAWRRLERMMPSETMPKLVLAGEIGALAGDVMMQLLNSFGLGGQVIVVTSPTVALRSALLRDCLFCIAPAPGGGWGRADFDAAFFGKVCLSETAVEGALAIDTLNAAVLASRMRDLLAGAEAAPGRSMRGWDDVARDVAAAVGR
jgi:HAMP domain-containing protein